MLLNDSNNSTTRIGITREPIRRWVGRAAANRNWAAEYFAYRGSKGPPRAESDMVPSPLVRFRPGNRSPRGTPLIPQCNVLLHRSFWVLRPLRVISPIGTIGFTESPIGIHRAQTSVIPKPKLSESARLPIGITQLIIPTAICDVCIAHYRRVAQYHLSLPFALGLMNRNRTDVSASVL